MSTSLPSKIWQDLDQNHVLKAFEDSIPRVESLNFVINFDDAKAEGALDLDSASLTQLWNDKV